MDVQALVNQPSESLSVELKGWIGPESDEGIAKIVKAAIAMRNNNGGYLLIGFHNNGKPDLDNIPQNIRDLFHIDKIQGIVTKYSSESFEIEIHFPTREGREFPVIEIGQGVKTPVAAKKNLPNNDCHGFIKENKVYIRSLNANNTPSTTEATWKDWDRIVEICFENREADIGRFLRRHLGGISPEIIRQAVSTIIEVTQPEETVKNYLQEGENRYQTVVKERNITPPNHGAWEVGVIIVGDVPQHSANLDFLNLLTSINPRYSGWPVWLDSRGFDDSSRPFVIDGVWEALIVCIGPDYFSNELDYWRLDPVGRFFLRRALEDDISKQDIQPFTVLDYRLATLRTAEAIAVGLSFAKAMGCNLEQTQLTFGFKWTRLKGRLLCSRADNRSTGQEAYQNEVFTELTVPLDTPTSALGQFVHQATKPLFEVFNGFPLSVEVTEDLTRRLIERR